MKYMYLWERLDDVTDYYHREAGIVVLADSFDEAKKKILEETERKTVPQPHFVFCLDESKETNPAQDLFVFPDAGCC